MKDDELIDLALREHARHQGNPDEDFLKELETKLDQPVEKEETTPKERKPVHSRRMLWQTLAAAIVVALTLVVLFKDEAPEETKVAGGSPLYSIVAEVEEEAPTAPARAPRLATSVERKGILPSKSDLVIASNSDPLPMPIRIPDSMVVVPEGIEIDGDFDLGGGWGDGDRGGSGGGINPIRPMMEGSSGNRYGPLIEQGYQSPLRNPLSTFSVDVDTASYTNIRRLVQDERTIHPDAVRIEEMINYFDYRYPEPGGEHPFSVFSEAVECPWNTEHRLVRIALKGKEVEQERKPANLVFLIDVSGSMKSHDKLPLLVNSFEILLKSLGGNDRVSLVVYAGREEVLLRPTAVDEQGRQVIRQALRRLSAGGSTNGSAGISAAYDLARSGFIEGGVNRVILATDGDFNVGTTSQSELLKLVKNQAEGQISLTVLGFGQGNLNDAMMEQLTNNGDGNYFYLDSLREGQRVFGSALTGTIETIAKDVKIQVEFNPGKVSQYRLIGYANRRLKPKDFNDDQVDAGEIGAGHTVTALYEVIPAGAVARVADGLKFQQPMEEVPKRKIVDSPEMLTVKLRYKKPEGGDSILLSQALTDQGATLEGKVDLSFSSAVALWGMLLRDSEYAVGGTIDLVEKLALEGLGADPNGQRAEFLDLVRKWRAGRK